MENKKSPEQELEALKKLKKKLFVTVSAYMNQSEYLQIFNYALSVVGDAGLMDECVQFMDESEEYIEKNACDVDQYMAFLKDYFGV